MSYFPDVIEEFNYDESNELLIEEFLEKANLTNFNFYKIADSGLKEKKQFDKNPEVNPIAYTVVDGLVDSYKKYKEVVYILCIMGRVVKIGGTYTGMAKRHRSYNCGTRKARKKGTCSVTNYHITEAQYAAISNGKKVEWYVFDVPPEKIKSKVWNDDEVISPKVYMFWESKLCKKYKNITGHRPILSKNTGVE